MNAIEITQDILEYHSNQSKFLPDLGSKSLQNLYRWNVKLFS